ncbi:response regulator transcription factor [Ethanoligenens harbinense]|nr:response regulator transcription factor [Ethanoligenens harbinense]AVQ95304.1 DNA-binding response regulator [Ethanoligenens harbinense YUAN-3]AYF37968.1 DNA-binding response regulator [Ethanoligenens harbinense]AYF40715.1 DNA-binding response regulator [Ethanoligenens harbinense]QCN91548.1 DNA-binding response regulator [Ethanoligenens harbinense]
MQNRILIADDDREIVEVMDDALRDEGFETVRAYNGKQVLEQLSGEKPIDLFILDIMMPEMDGLETLRHIRERTDAPVLILSARGREIDKVIGLRVGADDYVSKPFSVDELMARVGAHLRRENKHRQSAPVTGIGALKLDPSSWTVEVDGKPVELSGKEFQILSYLLINAGQTVSREQIYAAVWKDAFGGDLSTVTVHIKNLRDKLGAEGRRIRTVWGIGYRLERDLP